MAFGRATAGLWGQEPYGRHDLPCVRVADFDRERLTVTTPVPTLRSIPPRDRPGRLLSRGDLLIEKSGGGERQPVGRVVFFDGEGEAVSSNFIARLPSRPKHSSRYSLYLHAALYSSGWNRLSIKQTTGIQNLDLDAYLDLKWRFPPFDEQQAIADYLDRKTTEIVDLVEKNRRNIRLLTEERQAVVRRAVTQGIDPRTRLRASGVPGLGHVPEHWEVRRIRTAVAHVVDSSADDAAVPLRLALENVEPWSGAHVGADRDITLSSAVKRFRARDVLLGRLRPYLAKVVCPKESGVCVGEFLVLRPTSNLIYPEFLAYWLRAKPTVDRITSATFGAKMPRTEWRFIGNMDCPIPPRSEQVAIVRHLDQATTRAEATISGVSREIELLTEYRARLIADVVTGRLDVREAADGLSEPKESRA